MAGQRTVENDSLSSSETHNTNGERSASIQSDSSVAFHIILGVILIVLALVVVMIVSLCAFNSIWSSLFSGIWWFRILLQVKWIYTKRKYNRLRHYLIPTYTFDPNEEETWDVDIDNQENAIIAGPSLQVEKENP